MNSLAVLAFVGVVLLLLANSALLRLVRDLQAALVELRQGVVPVADRSHLQVPAFADAHGGPAYVLIVDDRCPACRDRARHFAELAGDDQVRVLALSTDEACLAWFADTDVTFHHDSALVGHIGISVTPTLIHYGPDGHESWRRVVPADRDMDCLMLTRTEAAGGRARTEA